MEENRGKVIEAILRHEGGLSDHPKDPGGRTNMGVTQDIYNAWRHSKGMPQQGVGKITSREVECLYSDFYLEPIWFRALPPGTDYAVADFAVHSGATLAVIITQAAVNIVLGKIGANYRIRQDGVMGPETLAAIRRVPAARLLKRLKHKRLQFLGGLEHWPTFARGWARRVEEVTDEALHMAARPQGLAQPSSEPCWLLQLLGKLFTWRTS